MKEEINELSRKIDREQGSNVTDYLMTIINIMKKMADKIEAIERRNK